ncbi:fibronectin type III domain-containing protein [Marinitenerispora sediminis]|uniref:fibronectin type III domain-containing protein n=1 Tax=Marinitenerispora sediminis TaxID=1931232 RepID=UPI001F1B047F|nr:fibronectin type III domain-containing protein [Marinitenerispora sediminis]
MRERIVAAARRLRSGSGASGVTTVVLAVALVCTVFGAGALGRADEMSDGNVWLWSSLTGEISRVNGHSGQVDLVSRLPESAGDRVRVTQNDQYLILHDLDTGRMTAIDLNRMGFSGRVDLGGNGDFTLALGEDTAVVIDRRTGEVQPVDPATLQSTGERVRMPAPLVGGAFDDEGALWLGVPSQGTVAGVAASEGEVEVARTVAVADPGDDLAVSALDRGSLTVNRSDDELTAVTGTGDPVVVPSPIPLDDATVPDRTTGDLLAVTSPEAGRILTLSGIEGGEPELGSITVDLGDAGTAVPYEGRVYLPFAKEGLVRVYAPDGVEEQVVTVPDAEGDLEVEVREGHLFVNAPDSRSAVVVDPSGRARVIDKYAPPPGPGGDPAEPGSITDPLPAAEPPASDPGPDAPAPPAEGDGEDGGLPLPGLPSAGPGTPPRPEPEESEEPEEPETGEAPGAPTPVSHEAGDGSVTLSWSAAYSPDAPVQRYVVTWDGGRTTVGGDELGTTITGLANGTAYRFRVTATNRYGTGPAAQSAEVTPSRGAPAAPDWVSAEAGGDGTATVTWAPVDGAVDYLVSTQADPAADVADRTSTGTSVEVTGLRPGSTYTFSVVARGEGGVSGEAASSAPLTLPETELGAPAEVSFQVSGGTIAVTWSAVEGAAQYRVSPGGDGAISLETATVSGTSHSYQRTSGRCFSFTVHAVGSDGTAAATGTTSPASCVLDFG